MSHVANRPAAFAALLATAWATQACSVPTEPDIEDGRLGTVEQAVDPGTYRFWLSDDGNVVFNNYLVPDPDPTEPPDPFTHSITLGTGSNPTRFFDLVIDAEGQITDASSTFFPGQFEHLQHVNPSIPSCSGFIGDPLLTTFRFIGIDQETGTESVVDPGAGTITLVVEAEVEFLNFATLDNCTTEPFPIKLEGAINDPSGCAHGLGNTEFCIDAMNFTVDMLPATCDFTPGYGTCLNDDFELGSDIETVLDLHGHTDPGIHD